MLPPSVQKRNRIRNRLLKEGVQFPLNRHKIKVKQTPRGKKLQSYKKRLILRLRVITIAGKHISIMDADGKSAVVSLLTKTAKKNENRVVKDAVVAVAYAEACKKAFVEHLQSCQRDIGAMVHPRRRTIIEEQGILATIKIGDWIDAESDYSVGIISDGGIGCVFGLYEEVHGMEGAKRTVAVDVHYIVDNRKERRVLLKRCVVIPLPYKSNKVVLRTRKVPAVLPSPAPPQKSPLEWLKYGLEMKLHTKNGWLRDLLVTLNLLKPDDKKELWARVLSDYKCQLSCLEGMKEVLGDEFVDPRDYKGTRGKDTGGRYVSTKSKRQTGVPLNVYTIQYLMWAYNVNKCSFKRRLKSEKMGINITPDVTDSPVNKGLSVIESRELAQERYNPKCFYAHEQAMMMRNPTLEDQRVPEWTIYKYRIGYFGKQFDKLVESGQDYSEYTRLAKQHDVRQPFIKEDILDALKLGNNCHSYRALSKHITNWCAPYTIETWLRSHPTYNIYAKNIKPGLTPQNREKQVIFLNGCGIVGGYRPANLFGFIVMKNGFMHLYGAVMQRHAKSWGYYESPTPPITSPILVRSWRTAR